MANPRSFAALGLWLFASVALGLLLYWRWGRRLRPRNATGTFVALSLVGAAVGETAYMISRPLHAAIDLTRIAPEILGYAEAHI